jgi:glyoxylase-like metal-dependent hydrolase (beta-lactamase superfamily II)
MYCFSARLARLFTFIIGLATSLLATNTSANNGLITMHVDGPVYAIVGELSNRSPSNLGNNATFGVIVTEDSVVLIDAGAGTIAAQALEEQVRTITQLPISHVINTGGQDHRWLGNAYFAQQGATIIASEAAIADHEERAADQINRLESMIGQDPMAGLDSVTASQTFAEDLDLTIGGIDFQLRHLGAAHTPGDSWIYLPQHKVVFSGDIAYGERMLGVIGVSDSASWVEVFAAMAELDSAHVIPGHGKPSTIEQLTAESYDYLVHLRTEVGNFIDDGGDLSDIRQVDQSKFSHLTNYEGISPGNALRVFEQMEWE